jgi:hypothetical protein
MNRKVITSAIALVMLATALSGKTYYVSTNGKNSNRGTAQRPFRTNHGKTEVKLVRFGRQ